MYLNIFGTLASGRSIECGRLMEGRLMEVLLYFRSGEFGALESGTSCLLLDFPNAGFVATTTKRATCSKNHGTILFM